MPYLVPFGGSGALGARGYREAGEEILAQRPDVRHVVTALGSGSTMAGLVAALGADRVLGVDVGALPDPAAVAAAFASALTGSEVTAAHLRVRRVRTRGAAGAGTSSGRWPASSWGSGGAGCDHLRGHLWAHLDGGLDAPGGFRYLRLRVW